MGKVEAKGHSLELSDAGSRDLTVGINHSWDVHAEYAMNNARHARPLSPLF